MYEQNVTKWFTISEIVDVDTGELINKRDLKKYIIIKKYKTIEINENKGTRKFTTECKHGGQTELF